MKTYNIGMAGSGFMGKAHTYAYKAIPFFYGELPIKVNLRAICSLPLEDRAESRQGICGRGGGELQPYRRDQHHSIFGTLHP